MKPETGGSGFNPEAQSNPYAQIPDLVQRSILVKPDRARRSKRELIKQIVSDPYSDPLVLAIAEAQEVLISAKDARQIRNAKELLGEIIHQGSGGDTPREELVFRVNQQLLDISIRIAQNDNTIQEKRFLKRELPDNYGVFVSPFIRMQKGIEEELQRGTQEISMLQVGKPLSQDELDKLQETLEVHNQWQDSLRKVTGTVKTDIISFNTVSRDTLIDLLKNEPESTDIGKEKLYAKKYDGVALEEIEQMSYPVSIEEWSKITNYLIAARLDMESNPNLAGKANAITMLFFNSTPFHENITYQNSRILGNINSWQESLVYYLAFQQNEKTDMQIKNLVQTTEENIKFAPLIAGYFRAPFATDPGSIDERTQDISKRHPLFADSVSYYLNHHGELDLGSTLEPAWEISKEYFKEEFLPQLKRRIASLGINDRFDEEIRRLEQDALVEGHLKFIKSVFEKNCGQEYLEKLQVHSQEIKEVTEIVWQEATERMHFLPMQQGENILEFSEDSIPNIQGLESIGMTRVGSPKDWKIRVTFQPLNVPFVIHAFLTQDGKLEFNTPLQREIPGLYTMLNHIAVLTFHDLVVQERKEREVGTREPKSELNGKPENGNKAKGDTPDRTYSIDLPRVQQDRKLVADVYEATNREPRRVELHDRLLPGAREYQAAVELYQEAVTGHVSEDTIHWAIKELEEARKKAFRISEEKRLNAPAKFQLPSIQDPITGEVRYLKTWVVEHSNPKPTPEELKSPVKLYERYYKDSSALASLDQMKPWFIGQ